MSAEALLLTSIASLALTSLASIGARALRDFSRSELQELCQRRERLERFSEILHLHETTALGVEMIGSLATALFASSGLFWAVQQSTDMESTPWRVVLGAAVVIGLAMAIMRVGIPWSITRLYAEPFLYHTWPLWRLMGGISAPLRGVTRLFDAFLHRLAGKQPNESDEETIEEEIRTIVTEGHREGLLEEDAREMIEGVIELGDADVSQIMTPRTDMHMLPLDLSWAELLRDVIGFGHTRIPVFDTTRDDIVGVLYAKDLLPELAKPDESDRRTVGELARKPIFVPETKAVDDLLEMFQQERTHIALVLDEYGGVAGLVTIEDVLEEIVGEIVDEYDDVVEEEIRQLGDDACEALGRTHVDEVNEALGLSLPEDQDFDTIAGFVFTELGRVPAIGDRLEYQGAVRVTVLAATKRRIERVRVERIAAPAAESA